jgi:ABC-2 type transport system ATP-binding protein
VTEPPPFGTDPRKGEAMVARRGPDSKQLSGWTSDGGSHWGTNVTDPAIVVEGVRRSFGSVRALDAMSMTIPAGEVCALVGPNGAGKTTLLLILAGLLAPDKGRVSVGGCDPVTDPFGVHSEVGWMPDFFGTYDDLTAREYLELFGACYRMSPRDARRRAAGLLALVGLEKLADQPVHTLSRGRKQRLGFARALVHRPSILLLDEPASGLDPRARVELRELVRAQKDEGVTVVVSSHILGELEEMSDVVAFVESGRCRGVYPLAELPTASDGRRYRIRALDPIDGWLESSGIGFEAVSPKRVVVEVSDDAEAAELLARLVREGMRVVEIAPVRGGLEDAFLALGGEGT